MIDKSSRCDLAHSLLDGLLQNRWSNDRIGIVLNDIADEIRRGNLSVYEVLKLLNSNDENQKIHGAWLLSELGSMTCQIFKDIKVLICSNISKVRFLTADCYLLCANDGVSLERLAKLVEDEEAAVRWKAIDSLSKLSDTQINIGREWYKNNNRDSSYYEGFGLLSGEQDPHTSFETLRKTIIKNDVVLKRFSAAAAIRLKVDEQQLKELATLSQDVDVVEFCLDFY